MKKLNFEVDMLHGPVLGGLFKFFIPVMLSGILQLLFNAADIVVVGQFAGKESLAAVGSTSALVNLIINLFMGLSIGASIVIAQRFGASDASGVERAVHTSMLISAVSGVVIAVFGFFASPWLLTLMGSPPDVLPLASLYLKIYFIGAPALLIFNFGATIVRTSGDTARPLFILFGSGIINVLLNLLFVIKFGMGVAGVALATIISEVFSAVLVVALQIATKGQFHLSLRRLRIDKPSLFAVLRYGLPAGLQGCVFSLSNVVIQGTVNSFGSTVIAGNSASASIQGFIYAGMNSVYQAVLVFTGQNYGAGRYKRIDSVRRCGILLVTAVGLLLGVSSWVFSRQIFSIYSSDPEIIEMARISAGVIFPSYFLCGIMEVGCGLLRGTGHSTQPAITSVLLVCVLRLVWIFTLVPLFPRTPDFVPALRMVYMSYPVSWIAALAVHYYNFSRVRKKYLENTELQ